MRARVLLAAGVVAALTAVVIGMCGTGARAPLDAVPTGPEVPGAAAHNATSTPFNFVSIPALAAHRYDGRDLRLERVLVRSLGFTRYAVSYRSGALRITGVMDVPTAPGRHALVVLAHGWSAPDRYRSGSRFERERRLLALNGFVALQIDYRNYGGSTRESVGVVRRPLGYPEDLVNAVLAVRRARLPSVDASRIGLFGRSMGGGVVLNALAAKPGLADAAVLSSPVSSGAADNYRRWVADDARLRARVVAAYGTPATRPDLWRQASARTYLDRVHVPILIAHGTADDVCPIAWSEATAAALRRGGDDVTLQRYPGEDHRFGPSWHVMTSRAIAFFHAHLDG